MEETHTSDLRWVKAPEWEEGSTRCTTNQPTIKATNGTSVWLYVPSEIPVLAVSHSGAAKVNYLASLPQFFPEKLGTPLSACPVSCGGESRCDPQSALSDSVLLIAAVIPRL